jgi:glutamate racemase
VKRALIFDSGVGGLSVFDAIAAAGLPLVVDYAADNAWLPYGDKPDSALKARVPALLRALNAGLEPDIIVMACNTASTIALDEARAAIATPIVGVVPPIKPAAELTRTGVIGLLATPATIARPYTDGLVGQFAADKKVIRFGSTRLVAAAEAKLAGAAQDDGAVADAIAGLFGAPDGDGIDVVALACTHFPLLRDELTRAGPTGCVWLDSGAAIARRVAQLLDLTAPAETRARRALFSAPTPRLQDALVTRGFSALGAIGPAPQFETSPVNATGAA